jgi:hypothetical protein
MPLVYQPCAGAHWPVHVPEPASWQLAGFFAQGSGVPQPSTERVTRREIVRIAGAYFKQQKVHGAMGVAEPVRAPPPARHVPGSYTGELAVLLPSDETAGTSTHIDIEDKAVTEPTWSEHAPSEYIETSDEQALPSAGPQVQGEHVGGSVYPFANTCSFG